MTAEDFNHKDDHSASARRGEVGGAVQSFVRVKTTVRVLPRQIIHFIV